MRNIIVAAMLCLGIIGPPAVSGDPAEAKDTKPETVTLRVDNMTCRMCPVTVRKALTRVDGVIDVTAKYEGDGIGWARVTFDPATVGIARLIETTTRAGYPSSAE